MNDTIKQELVVKLYRFLKEYEDWLWEAQGAIDNPLYVPTKRLEELNHSFKYHIDTYIRHNLGNNRIFFGELLKDCIDGLNKEKLLTRFPGIGCCGDDWFGDGGELERLTIEKFSNKEDASHRIIKLYQLFNEINVNGNIVYSAINPLPTETTATSIEEPLRSNDNAVSLPYELNTEQARKYFDRAIEGGYMEQTAEGYKWLFGEEKGQVRLGYFCLKIFDQPRPINLLEDLFKVKRLGASITQASYSPKRVDAIKWRTEIDKNIFYD